jgi:quercetin dioxygenase-like cupin family protein
VPINAKSILGAALLAVVAVVSGPGTAAAQGAAPMPVVTPKDPPGPVPDPTHIPFTLPADVKWVGNPERSQSAVLFGDPSKPGMYGVVMKWMPGAFSRPHFHDQDREIYVVSGVWYVSSSNVFDERTTYPMPAGSIVHHVANTVHWDGNRQGATEPAVMVLVGMGPVKSVQVDEHGNPAPSKPH